MGIFHQLHRVVHPRKLTIVMYHSISAVPAVFHDWCCMEESEFRDQLRYLKRCFRVVSLQEGVERMQSGRLEGPTAALTFDDGYQNNFDIAFPILVKEGLPATVFLATGLVDTDKTVWSCQLFEALASTSLTSIRWRGRDFGLVSRSDKESAYRELLAGLKRFPHSRLLAQLAGILEGLGYDIGHPVLESSACRMLSSPVIRQMAGSGLIEFGAHTHAHAILSRLSPHQQRREIELSIAGVEDLTGKPCRLFAYPNGQPEDYTRETIAILKECGIRMAVTTREGPNTIRTPLLELKRVGIGADKGMLRFRLKVHHLVGSLPTVLARRKSSGAPAARPRAGDSGEA